MKSIIKRSLYYKSPKWIKKIFALIPAKWKLGLSTFNRQKSEIKKFEIINNTIRESYILNKINSTLSFASKYDFYQNYYGMHGKSVFKIRHFEELAEYPVITKQVIIENDFIEEVRIKTKKYYEANTGGSSGEPFSFILPNNIYSKLWAYKENVWKDTGYTLGDSVLSLRGHNFREIYQHQTIYNFFYLNANKLNINTISIIIDLIRNNQIKYLHGYPSNLLKITNLLKKEGFNWQFKGIFTSSEYISISDTLLLKKSFNCPVISIYEQSESTLFAYRNITKDLNYTFNLSYGFPEFKPFENDLFELIGTSFINPVMPLIRYETGDIVQLNKECQREKNPEKVNDIVGRTSEVIKYKNETYSLTGIIYGQHLPIFNHIENLQVYYDEKKFNLIFKSTKPIADDIKSTSIKLIKNSLPSDIEIVLTRVENLVKRRNGKHKILITTAEYEIICNQEIK